MALPLDIGFGDPADGGQGSGGSIGLQNLDGVYTVSSRVLWLRVGHSKPRMSRGIGTPYPTQRGRYRVEQYDLDGAREYDSKHELYGPRGAGPIPIRVPATDSGTSKLRLLETRFGADVMTCRQMAIV